MGAPVPLTNLEQHGLSKNGGLLATERFVIFANNVLALG